MEMQRVRERWRKLTVFAAAAIDVGVFRSMITSSRALVRRPESRISHARKKSGAAWKRSNNNNENIGFEIHFDANEERKKQNRSRDLFGNVS